MVEDIAITADRGALVVGHTDSIATQSQDIWLIKFDAHGQQLWSKTVGNELFETAHAVAVTPDGGYIVGGDIETDVLAIRIDRRGNVLWKKTFGYEESWSHGNDIQSTDAGGYIIAGNIETFHPRMSSGAWVMKLDPYGELVWDQIFETGNAQAIVKTPDGGYLIAGHDVPDAVHQAHTAWFAKLTHQGDIEWEHNTDEHKGNRVFALQATPDGGFVGAGQASKTDTGEFSATRQEGAWVVKLDAHGVPLWEFVFAEAPKAVMLDIQTTSDGGYIAVGSTSMSSTMLNSSRVLIVKLSAEGKITWHHIFGHATAAATAVHLTPDGKYKVIGVITTPVKDWDAWLMMFDANGSVIKPSSCEAK